MSNPLPYLPTEVLRDIFVYLDGSPFVISLDLVSASLVCQDWNAAARSLFDSSARFGSLLQHRSCSAGYVRRLARLLAEAHLLGLTGYSDTIRRLNINVGHLVASDGIEEFGGETRNPTVQNAFVEIVKIASNLEHLALQDNESAALDSILNSKVSDLWARLEPYCHHVTSLTLHGVKPSTTLASLVRGTQNLRHLHLDSHIPAKHDLSLALAECRHVQHVRFDEVDEDQALFLLESWEDLRGAVLDCDDWAHPNRPLIRLAHHHPGLQTLELTGLGADDDYQKVEWTSAVLCGSMRRHQQLERLVVQSVKNLDDAFLVVLGREAARLRHLRIYDCHGFTGKEIADGRAWTATDLSHLDLRQCSRVEAMFVKKIVMGCARLTEVLLPRHLAGMAIFLQGYGYDSHDEGVWNRDV